MKYSEMKKFVQKYTTSIPEYRLAIDFKKSMIPVVEDILVELGCNETIRESVMRSLNGLSEESDYLYDHCFINIAGTAVRCYERYYNDLEVDVDWLMKSVNDATGIDQMIIYRNSTLFKTDYLKNKKKETA